MEKYDLHDLSSIRVRVDSRTYKNLDRIATKEALTRQEASFSIQYLIARMLAKKKNLSKDVKRTFQDYFSKLALGPLDFTKRSLTDPLTLEIMKKVDVIDGGELYNQHYPEGIPSNLSIYFKDGSRFVSGMTKFPFGHSQNNTVDTNIMLLNKFSIFGSIGLENHEMIKFIVNLQNIDEMTNDELTQIYSCPLKIHPNIKIDE